jgi:hypothetical protein
MTPREIDTVARQHAIASAPPPKWTPSHGGMIGAIVAGFCLGLFVGFAGTSTAAHPAAFFMTIAVGFLAPFLYLKQQERAHQRAFAHARRRLQAENDAVR